MVSWGEVEMDGRVDVGKGSGWKDKESIIVGMWDDGEAISVLLGCVMVKAGLKLKGDKGEDEGENENDTRISPFSSEMNVFQSREIGEGEKEYFLSKLGRLYGKEGILRSGSSGFYSLSQYFE